MSSMATTAITVDTLRSSGRQFQYLRRHGPRFRPQQGILSGLFELDPFLQSFRHFTPITTIDIPGINDFPGNQLIRWGQNGLAFTTSGGQIILVSGNFLDPIAIPPPVPVVVPTPAPTPTPTAQTPTITSLSPSGVIARAAYDHQ